MNELVETWRTQAELHRAPFSPAGSDLMAETLDSCADDLEEALKGQNNNFPEELTKPPDGYEITGEFRVPLIGEYYWSLADQRVTQRSAVPLRWLGKTLHPFGSTDYYPCIILRKVKPPTVMVDGLPREFVERVASGQIDQIRYLSETVVDAFREALEREANE